MPFTAIRNGNLGARYSELSSEIIEDEDNLLIVVDSEHMLSHVEGEPYVPTPAEINAARKEIRGFMYRRDADSFAMKMLRNEATREDWDAARAAIVAKWPDVV